MPPATKLEHGWSWVPEKPTVRYEKTPGVGYAWASVRIALGAIFLWAFLDKLLGLGFATAPDRAWLAGGSPTLGFLKFGTAGPLAPAFQAVAGHPVVDALFMVGLLGIGLALVTGVGMRVAAASGVLMMTLMWAAHLPPESNPLLDDHVIYALVLVALATSNAGDVLGFGRAWSGTRLVKRFPLLR